MFDIYVKDKDVKKINDENVVLIIKNNLGKYEIFTKDMNKFFVKKKSKKHVKKLTKKKYTLTVQDNLWINTRIFKQKNTFTMDKIREMTKVKKMRK